MKDKTDLKQHVQFDKQRTGCGMGCCSIGCLGIVGMCIVVGVAGYFSLFHSSLPLQLIEAAIEEDGEVEIEGLTGTLSSGFSADEIRFKTVDDRWSNLTDIKFKYDSDSSFFGTDRIVIEELSVKGGTIYADWDPDENELEFDPDISEEINEELNEIEGELEEMRDEIGHSPDLRELRIDLVSVSNIKIINPETELEITIDEMKFNGFLWEEGKLKNLGELLVHSSQLDLETVPAVEYAEMENSRRFEGTLRSQTDHRLKTDVPFVVDFGVDDNLKVSITAEIFDGGLRFVEAPSQTELSYNDFSPGEFIDFENGPVLASNINMNLKYGTNQKKGPISVNPEGSFDLGDTRFTDLRIEQPDRGPSVVVAQGNVGGKNVQASVTIAGPTSPWWNVTLASEAFDTPKEIWAQTLFNRSFDELDEDQQVAIQTSLPQPKAVAHSKGKESDAAPTGKGESSVGKPVVEPVSEPVEVQ